MISKNKSPLSKKLGKTRRSLRGSIGKMETNHHFSSVVLKDNHLLESPGRLKWVEKCQDSHQWNVGAVKEIIGTNIVPTEMTK
jgi:hypothetical protein